MINAALFYEKADGIGYIVSVRKLDLPTGKQLVKHRRILKPRGVLTRAEFMQKRKEYLGFTEEEDRLVGLFS